MNEYSLPKQVVLKNIEKGSASWQLTAVNFDSLSLCGLPTNILGVPPALPGWQ